MEKRTAISFLFGAGFSQAAGYPSTSSLTEKVISGVDIIRHTDETYHFCPRHDSSDSVLDTQHVRFVTQFVAKLKAEVETYFACFPGSCGRFPNYEDLCFVADQICGTASGEWDNPAVNPLIEKLNPAVQQILSVEHGTSIQTILDLAREAQHYITDVVWESLLNPPQTTNHISLVTDALRDRDFAVAGIATLNHDSHLEKQLRVNGVQVNDGFGAASQEVRYWEPGLLLNRPGSLPYLKLHGSVDWFRFRPSGATWWEEKVGIPLSHDFWHTRDANGELQTPVDGRPLLLVGTLNKINSYSAGVFGDLHFAFRRMLSATKMLLVVGYGFGDKGINTAILEWVYAAKGRSIVYVNPDPIDARNRARGAIRNKWDDWTADQALRAVPARVENLRWIDLRQQHVCV